VSATDEQFATMLARAIEATSARTVAAATGITQTTVERWAEGKSYPHPAARQRLVDIFDVLSRDQQRVPRRTEARR
jgi:transcriptional regulator with XRE-family HTH domain